MRRKKKRQIHHVGRSPPATHPERRSEKRIPHTPICALFMTCLTSFFLLRKRVWLENTSVNLVFFFLTRTCEGKKTRTARERESTLNLAILQSQFAQSFNTVPSHKTHTRTVHASVLLQQRQKKDNGRSSDKPCDGAGSD